MDAKVFKKLIREAVKEAIREELKQLLAEHAASQLMRPNSILAENLNFGSGDVGPNHFPMTPAQQMAKRAQIEQQFKQQTVPTNQINDWSLGTSPSTAGPVFKQPKQAPTKGDFSAFIADTAMNFNPGELMGGE